MFPKHSSKSSAFSDPKWVVKETSCMGEILATQWMFAPRVAGRFTMALSPRLDLPLPLLMCWLKLHSSSKMGTYPFPISRKYSKAQSFRFRLFIAELTAATSTRSSLTVKARPSRWREIVCTHTDVKLISQLLREFFQSQVRFGFNLCNKEIAVSSRQFETSCSISRLP